MKVERRKVNFADRAGTSFPESPFFTGVPGESIFGAAKDGLSRVQKTNRSAFSTVAAGFLGGEGGAERGGRIFFGWLESGFPKNV
ncbi:MAG: hypothetical protein NC226_07120 [Bacteroides cellulosilyticus]|nr:hypothetical protein [Bacteroides cellulosilyticus]